MPGSTTVLGLTTITQADTPNHTLHFSTGGSERVEAIFTGAASPAGNITLAFGALTGDRGLRVTQEWNNGAIGFTAFSVAVTNTASDSTSLLANLTVGGVSQWKVARDGAVTQTGALTATTGDITATAGKFVPGASTFASRSGASPAVGRDTLTAAGTLTLQLGDAAGAFNFVNAGYSATLMTLVNGGNLGLGVTPSAWHANYNAVQVGASGALWSNASGGAARFTQNVFNDGADKALVNGGSFNITMSNGAMAMYTYPTSGTAGNAITGSQRFQIGDDGRVGIGDGSLGTRTTLLVTESVDSSVSSAGTGQFAYGVYVVPELNKTASDAGSGGLIALYVQGAGNVLAGMTAQNVHSAFIAGPTVSNSGTIVYGSSLLLGNPVLGGTVSNLACIHHVDSNGIFTTTGVWQDSSSEFLDGKRFKWPRGLLAERLDVLAVLRQLKVRAFAYGDDATEEFAGLFAEEAHAVSPLISDGKTMAHGGWALALAACQALDAKLTAALEAR